LSAPCPEERKVFTSLMTGHIEHYINSKVERILSNSQVSVMCRICENYFTVAKLREHLKLCQRMVDIKKEFFQRDH
jgi:hypothetical protein